MSHKLIQTPAIESSSSTCQERPKRRRGSRFIHADVDIEALQFSTDGFQPFTRAHTSSIMESQPRLIIDERAKLQKFAKPVDKRSALRNQAIDEATSVPDRRVAGITGRDIQEKMSLRSMLRQATQGNDVVATQPLSFTVPRTTADSSQLVPPRSDSPLTPSLDSGAPGSSRHPARSNPVMTIHPELPQKQTHPPKKRDHPGKVPDTDAAQRQSPRKKVINNQDALTVLENPLPQVTNAIELIDKNIAKLKLSRAKTIELKKKGKRPFERRGKINDGTEGSQDHISCECGDERLEEDMICCDNCDEWQHTDCYGFASAQDPRIPDYHVCYSCLLEKNEGKLLEEMRNMALFRRALKIIWRLGNFPTSNKAFANKLGALSPSNTPAPATGDPPIANDRVIGCDLPTALQITRRLENEGFITNDVIKAKLHKKKVYKVTKTDNIVQLMEAEYFDPLKKISHHVSTYGELSLIESSGGLILRPKFENPTSPNIIRESLLEDTYLARAPSNTVPAGPMDTIVQNSQLEQVGNPTEEAIGISQPTTFARTTDIDMESTADEEDDTPVQKTTRDNFSRRESVMDHLKYSNHSNTASLNHKTPAAKQRLPFEIREFPEPMQTDAAELQTLGDTLIRMADAEPGRPRMNIGGVTQDIFVGEELETDGFKFLRS
ncbi:hypothetical protein Q9L58_007209 [Maublancomyces gigas]|uniref:Zinc finger PHD-type domain-containing protein n=1 Tax=Discina gigas TaxID=1032678 RepID=A0ABR3GD50_9PEZI